MTEHAKPVDELTVQDFQRHPIWRFTESDEEEHDETIVAPVTELPTDTLGGSLVGVEVLLANDQRVWAFISNVDTTSARMTEQFLTISLERDGQWFHLAHYLAFDFEARSPDRAAAFLGLPVDDVFPIRYDLSGVATGELAALVGEIPKEPRERLTMEEQFALMFP